MLVIAHRGANKEALENSWSAFEKAIEAGAVRIELDVQLTKDQHAVVVHDTDLKRVTGRALNVAEMTRAQIAAVKLKNGEPVPFLDEVVSRLLPRIELNIEVKGNDPALARAVCDIVADRPDRDKVIVSCFKAEPLKWIFKHHPAVKRACLYYWSDTWEWPHFSRMAPQLFLEECGTNIYHPHIDQVDENLMDQANNRGWQVYAWAPMKGEDRDREGIWTSLKTLGLHGLCTNYPRQLKLWLEDAKLDEAQYQPN